MAKRLTAKTVPHPNPLPMGALHNKPRFQVSSCASANPAQEQALALRRVWIVSVSPFGAEFVVCTLDQHLGINALLTGLMCGVDGSAARITGAGNIFFNANVNGDTGATHHNIDLDCSGGATTSSSLTLAGTTIRNPTGAANVTCIKVNSFDQVNIAGITHHDTNTKLFNLSSINRRERICGVSSASTVASTFSTTPKAVASAPTVTLPDHDSFFYQVTGSTQIDTITASWPGRVVILKFGAGGVIVSESGNVNLISTFTGSDEATLTLSCDGTDWYEVARAFLSAALYRSSIGLGTADSPQLTGIELSHATANTLTGLSGDAFIEGNLLYRAGGTDVPVADGGTGASTARTACSNLSTRYVLARSAVAVSHTGDTNETILATVTMPANALGANGQVFITALWSYTNSGNTKTLRCRFGGIGGQTYYGLNQTATAAVNQVTRIGNRNATNSQVGGPDGAANPFSATTDAVITSAVDTTAAVDIVFTAQLANTGETISLEHYVVEIVT